MSRIQSLKIKAKRLQKSKKLSGKPIKLKEAYDIIAKSAGHPSWRQMKQVIEQYAGLRPPQAPLPYTNIWYSDYQEARLHLEESQDSYLLPFERQFFICHSDYIEAIGISHTDPDLALVGRDWVHPADPRAFQRLLDKISANK